MKQNTIAMKQRILLLIVMTFVITGSYAQKTDKKITGYAITGQQKGHKGWKEVRLVDVTTGDEVKTIFNSTQEIEALNARTGKPIVKKDAAAKSAVTTISTLAPTRKVINLDQELDKANGVKVTRVVYVAQRIQSDKPFATNSAAMAYDKKHERLYYTPMNINQLRYIDLKSSAPKVHYFEDEAFGTAGKGGVDKQITRMVIASDGEGYALTNDAKSLIRFTTGKNPVITDLGSLTDDAANGKFSVHNQSCYGGDMIADASKNLYLISANRRVYQISIETKVAKYLGSIKGLPQGFGTNGAMVEQGSKVIVCSSESTEGYYRFDLTTLEAEKVSGNVSVFNASDLANGNLAFDKKKKDKKEKAEQAKPQPVVEDAVVAKQETTNEQTAGNEIAVFPNPVTDGLVKLSFTNQPAGKYQVQLLDLSGRLVNTQQININGSRQVAEFRLPALISAGTYYIKVFSETNKFSSTTKLVVQ